MKYYKNIKGFINHLKQLQNQPVHALRGADKLTEEQRYALVEITAFISNMLGDELSEFKD